jgi:glutaredoxin-like YruB-family protein
MSEVVVFTMQGCPHCKGVKDYLTEKGVKFTERDVLEDEHAMADFRALGFRGTPVTVIDGTPVVGFDREKLDEALAAKE